MPQKTRKPEGLKISQLAKLAGVPIPTVKHYLKEGLLPKPTKTGRTMSYYDRECVEKVRLIKRLRTERFFPLAVIKRIIESGVSINGELALGEALLNAPPVPTSAETTQRKEIAKLTGYSLAKIDQMESLGLINPRKTPHGKEYDLVDCQIVSLVRQREEAGLPFDYSLEMMSIYRKHIERIVGDDAKLFVRRMLGNSSASDAARYIREGDRALGTFMLLIKSRIVRENAEKVIGALNSAADHVREALRFRILSRTPPRTPRSPQRTGDSFWLKSMLAGSLRGDKQPALEALKESADLENLVLGLHELVNGRAEGALLLLNRVRRSKSLRPLTDALLGLAHVGRMPDAPGVLSPIHRVTEAISSFNASRRSTNDPEIDLLVSYLRGAGLAIIPDIFDTHKQAAADLASVMNSGLAGRAGDCKREVWKRVDREIRLKASYFLARMYLQDEQHEFAQRVLLDLKRKGKSIFYGKWAGKQLRRIKDNRQTRL